MKRPFRHDKRKSAGLRFALLATLVTLGFATTTQGEEIVDEIGPTPIRFYSGNLSVANFMRYWGTRKDDHYDGAGPGNIAVMQRTNCSAMCDYLAWCIVEPEEGKWDFSFHQNNERLLREAGIEYNIFSWIHFPPKWYEASDRFVPYQDLETGNSIEQISLWSPDLERVADTFYGKLAEVLGERIAFVRLAMPTEYGEIGYCAKMTHWLRPQEHAREAYWCGDPYAKKDFREKMLAKYKTMKALNTTWGTEFATADDIAMPDTEAIQSEFTESLEARRRWVDFVDWYQEAWVECLEMMTGVVKKHFPGKEIIASLGYGKEQAWLGNDEGRHIAAMARLGVACQTPGNIGYFPTRRNSSAARLYDVPYFTEPPGDVPPDPQLNRIYMDIANGVETWFDYLGNLDRAKHYFRAYKQYMTGAPPRTTVAVWHPTLDHWLHPEKPWSQGTLSLADPLRDAVAYEIVDDRMISDGALAAMNVRQLILCGAQWLDAAAWRKVHAWVREGGVLMVLGDKPIPDIEEGVSLWKSQAPKAIPLAEDSVEQIIPDPPPAYALDVCAPGTGTGYLSGDWFQIERPRWTAPGAGLRLPVLPSKTYQIDLYAALPPQAAPVDIFINGRKMLTLPAPLEGFQTFEWKSGPGEGPRFASLTFEGKGWIPSEEGVNADSRLLSLYVDHIEVREAGSDAALAPVPGLETTMDLDSLWKAGFVAMGKGGVLTMVTGKLASPAVADVLQGLCETAGERIGQPDWNAKRIDAGQDGILTVRFDDKILYFNPLQAAKTLQIEYRKSDFPTGTPRPTSMRQSIKIPARTIVSVPLVAAP